MNKRQTAIVLALHELELEPTLASFTKRLILQKSLYLVQAAGLDFGYYFSWYLRGPYCSSATRDLYAVAADPAAVSDIVSNWSIDDQSRTRLAALRELLYKADRGREPSREESELARRAELLASVHFLIDRKQFDSGASKGIGKTLREYGKDFNQDEVEKAIQSLQDTRLLPTSPS